MCSHTGTYTERQRETQREFREERKNQTVWCDGLKQRWGRAVSSFYHSIQSLHIPCPNGILVTLSSDTDDVLINSRCWREKSRSPQYQTPDLAPGPLPHGVRYRGGCVSGKCCTARWVWREFQVFFSMRLEDQGLPTLRREQGDERWEKSNNYPGHTVTQKS